MTCIVVEDEPLGAAKLLHFISRLEKLNLISAFQTMPQAKEWLEHNPVDLIFLDWHLGEFTGFDLLDGLKPGPRVIMATADERPAVASYRYPVDGYLLKPYSFTAFEEAVQKIIRERDLRQYRPEVLMIRSEGRWERLFVEDILFLEGVRDYVRIVLTERSLLTLSTLTDLIAQLPTGDFYRIHQSYVVALRHIAFINRSHVGVGGHSIPVSQRRRTAFLQYVGRR